MITSLYQSLCNMETNIADRVALRWYDEEKQGVAEVHYAQYAQDLRRFVAFLRAEYGDVRGKRVAILARNSYQYVICMYGTVIAGGVAVPLNLGKDWDAISYELGLTEPVCILQDGEFAEREPALTETYGSILKPMDAFSAYEPAEDVTEVEDLSALAFIMFTSGTTGRSKGVMLSERNMCSTLVTYSEVAENWITNRLPAGQKLPLSHMTLLPLFHMACFVCVMSYPPAGWALNLCGDIRDFYRDLGLMHSDVMASAPMLVETIYNDYKRGRVERLNGLWDLCCSSAALDPKMLEELAANGFVVNQCYGMTETFGDGILNFTQTADHMSAVGKPDDHCEYQLDETGEICIRGNSVMLGYYKDPEATAEVIDKDGWFHTGDLGRIDEDGYYYITGRKKNLIILANGENVSPEELEHKLAACPAVQECIVKEKSQKICAVVYCAKEQQAEVKDFITECNRTLPLYKRISALEFTAEPLPRNALGKLLRKEGRNLDAAKIKQL